MPPLRKSGRDDPERHEKTQARAPAFADEEGVDPEAANSTMARSPNPLLSQDPEAANQTQARARAPSRPPRRGAPSKSTRVAEEDEDVDDGDDGERANTEAEAENYSTGSNFKAVEEEQRMSESRLEGDGLEPMDPEIGPRTRAMPEVDEGEGNRSYEPDANDDNATRAGPPFKLEVTEGPDAGKSRRFKGVRMVLGRTAGVDWQLADQSVSRRHIELIHSDRGVLMRDLGSGNGTKVNGEKVSEKLLENGDVIALGKTRIKFVDEVAEFAKLREEKANANNTKFPAEEDEDEEGDDEDGGDEEGKSVEVSGSMMEEIDKPSKSSAGRSSAGKSAAASRAGSSAAGSMADSRAKSRSGSAVDGDEPRKSKASVIAGDGDEEPDQESSGGEDAPRKRRKKKKKKGEEPPGLGSRLKALPAVAKLAIFVGLAVSLVIGGGFIFGRQPDKTPRVDPNRAAAEGQVQAARKAILEKRFAEAVTFLEEAERLVPGIDRSNLLPRARSEMLIQKGIVEVSELVAAERFEDADKAMEKIPTDTITFDTERKAAVRSLHDAKAKYYQGKVTEFLAEGNVESAKATVERIPEDARAVSLAAIADFQKQLDDAAKEDRRNAGAAAAAAKRRAEEAKREKLALAFEVVERKFMSGDWERAASECARVVDNNHDDQDILDRAKMLKSAIPSFGKAYDDGLKKYRAKQLLYALKPLKEAMRTYKQIGLTGNDFGRDIETKLLDCLVAAGSDALHRDVLLEAVINFREALKFDEFNPTAKDGINQIESRAPELFEYAYRMKDSNNELAIRNFRLVIEITRPGDQLHEKAKNQLEAITNAH